MTIEEFGQHFEEFRPRLMRRACRKGLNLDEAEDVVQNAAEDLMAKCSSYPNARALADAFNTAINFGLKRVRRSWSQRRELQIEIRAQEGLTGAHTHPAASDTSDWNDKPDYVDNHARSKLLDLLPGKQKRKSAPAKEPSVFESTFDVASVSDWDRVTYGYGQLSADERRVADEQIDALARQEIVDRAPANVRPILQRLTEGASFRDAAKELGISGVALRQRLSRYQRENFRNGCHKPAVPSDLSIAQISPL